MLSTLMAFGMFLQKAVIQARAIQVSIIQVSALKKHY